MKRMMKNIRMVTTISLMVFLLANSCCNTQTSESDVSVRARKIHDRVLTIDSHTDTPMWMTNEGFDIVKDNSESAMGSKVDLVRMKEGGLDACFFAVFIGQGKRDEASNAKAREKALILFDTIHQSIGRHSDIAGIALSSEDAYILEKQNKRAIFIGMENGYPIGKDISLLADYYERGARYITLCHGQNNDICDSSTDDEGPEHDGLSEFGHEVVAEMNRLGLMIDVSHASDASFYDVLELSATPVIASHSCARALCDNARNLDDDMLRALAKNNGVIQMCILSAYVEEPAPNPERDSARNALREKYNNWEDLDPDTEKKAREEWRAMNLKYPRKMTTVAKVVDHIDHIVAVAGLDHVGIGTDFDGGGGVEECNDVSEMENITIELVKRGYSEEAIEKIWGKNLMRVMKEVETYTMNNE